MTEEELTFKIAQAAHAITQARGWFERRMRRQEWISLLEQREAVRNLSPSEEVDTGTQGTLL